MKVLDAAGLQTEFGLNRRQAYRVLHAVGVQLSARRWVVLPSRAEAFLEGVIDASNSRADDEGSRPREAFREP
jgi:hypothetical protein